VKISKRVSPRRPSSIYRPPQKIEPLGSRGVTGPRDQTQPESGPSESGRSLSQPGATMSAHVPKLTVGAFAPARALTTGPTALLTGPSATQSLINSRELPERLKTIEPCPTPHDRTQRWVRSSQSPLLHALTQSTPDSLHRSTRPSHTRVRLRRKLCKEGFKPSDRVWFPRSDPNIGSDSPRVAMCPPEHRACHRVDVTL
jgi:hypothetical protein